MKATAITPHQGASFSPAASDFSGDIPRRQWEVLKGFDLLRDGLQVAAHQTQQRCVVEVQSLHECRL